MARTKKRKVIRIEDIIRDKKDFLEKQYLGYTGFRAINSGKKLDLTLKDKLRFDAQKKNTCIICGGESTKLVYLAAGHGATQVQRYCEKCFDRLVDIDKMQICEVDNSHILSKLTIEKSRGGSPKKEDWRLLVPKGTHIK